MAQVIRHAVASARSVKVGLAQPPQGNTELPAIYRLW